MKKYEVKCWLFWFALLAILFFVSSCKTKQTNSSVVKDELKTEQSVNALIDNQITASRTETEQEFQIRTLREMISLLRVGYSGKSIDDNLSFELKKTIDGLKLQISGMGEATYKQDEKFNEEEFQKKFQKHIDSLFKQHLNAVLNAKEKTLKQHFEKEKEVLVKGFQTGFYITAAVIIIAMIVLIWLAKKFKLF